MAVNASWPGVSMNVIVSAVVDGLVRADVLGDAAGFAGDDVGVADRVEQRGLAVVDVTHDGDDRRTRLEQRVVVFVVVVAEQRVQLDLVLLPGSTSSTSAPSDSAMSSIISSASDCVPVTISPASNRRRTRSAVVRFSFGANSWIVMPRVDDDLAFGDRRVGRRELRHATPGRALRSRDDDASCAAGRWPCGPVRPRPPGPPPGPPPTAGTTGTTAGTTAAGAGTTAGRPPPGPPPPDRRPPPPGRDHRSRHRRRRADRGAPGPPRGAAGRAPASRERCAGREAAECAVRHREAAGSGLPVDARAAGRAARLVGVGGGRGAALPVRRGRGGRRALDRCAARAPARGGAGDGSGMTPVERTTRCGAARRLRARLGATSAPARRVVPASATVGAGRRDRRGDGLGRRRRGSGSARPRGRRLGASRPAPARRSGSSTIGLAPQALGVGEATDAVGRAARRCSTSGSSRRS